MKLFWRSILIFAIASFTPLAFGSPDWTNQGPDSNFNNSANWINTSGVGAVPGEFDSAHIFPGFIVTTANLEVTPGGSTTITIDAATDESVESVLVSSNFGANTEANGILNFNFYSGTPSTPTTLTVGADALLNAGVIVTGGATVNYVGNLQMSTGEIAVGTTNSFLDSNVVTGAGTLTLGAGTLNLDSTTATPFTIGLGTTGIVTQNSGSIVTTGQTLTIGGTSGTGTYTVNTGATLNIGTQPPGTPQSASYQVDIGAATGSVGNLNISGGTLNALNPATTIQVGGTGTGTVQQNGAVNLGGAASRLLVSENGNYELQSGALEIGENNTDTVKVDLDGAGTPGGTLTQTGGTLTAGAATTVIIGDAGMGNYSLSGASTVTADFKNGFTVGNQSGSIGMVTQTGGALSTENSAVIIGGAGAGTYKLSGASTVTAQFNAGLDVGGQASTGSGIVNQSGGALTTTTLAIGGAAGTGTGVYNFGGGTLTLTAGMTIGATGTFNQNSSITLTNPATQAVTIASGGAYNLNSGTLTTGGSAVFTGTGNFNFAGGTVTATGSAWTDALNGTVTGVSTLDTTNKNITLSGVLSDGIPGHGAFDIIGGGTVTLMTANNSAATWGLNIENGTVDATASLFPSSGAITIGSGGAGATGTLTLAVGSNVTLTGNVTSAGAAMTGAFNVNFAANTDTLKLTGATHFTGTTTLSGGGTLEVSSGTLGNIQGTLGKVTIGGPALSGTVNLAGTNSYTGLTTVNSGYTLFTSNLSGNLQNAGTFGSGLTPATLPATQTTTVSLGGQFNSTGAILLNTNGIVTDLYTVTGTSMLSGTVVLSGVGTITNHVFINAPAGLNTTGLTLVVPGSGVLFNASIHEVGGTEEELTTTQNPTASFARTPNELAVAGAIDPILTSPAVLPPGFHSLGIALNSLTAAQIPGALESLTPESLQYARMISFENSTFLAERINGVDADLRGGYAGLDTSAVSVVSPGFNNGLGRSLGSLLASDAPYHPPAPNGVNYYPGGAGATGGEEEESTPSSPQTWDSSTQVISDSTPPNPYMANQNPAGPETPQLSEFIGGDAVLADLNKNQSTANAPSSKASYTSSDATAGISYRMTSHLAAGVLFDFNHTDAKTDSLGSKTSVDSYSPGLFATYFDHGFYANSLFSFGYNNYANTRDVSFLGETASSHPHGRQYVGDLDFGYDFHPDKSWVIGPTVGVTYTHLDIDSFTETGAPGADLSVNSQSADSLRSRLGGHVIFQTNTGDVLLQPNITAMWQHEYLDNGSGITSSFNDFSSSPFTIQTAAPSRDSALLGIGMTATLNNSMALYLNYIADVGASDYFAQSVIGGFKARF